MKYTDLLIAIFLLCLFSFSLSGFMKLYSELNNKSICYIEKTNANEFISRSFKNTCEGKGFESLCQWQKSCKALWNLKYIGWSDATNVMLIPEKYKDHAYYGTWIGQNFEGEVYWKE